MNLNQFTLKSQEAIQKAQQIALEFGNQSIEPQHLLEGIFQSDENISSFLLKKSEADATLIRERNRENIEKLPKVEGGNLYPSQSLSRILLNAPNIAKKMGDEYVTIEHLWLALVEVSSPVSTLLKDMGVTQNLLESGIKELRKGSKATSASSEETYQSLNKYAKNFNELAAEGKLAQQAHGDERNLLLLQPSPSNDAGFAMTSSFTSMMLTALLVFDTSELAVKEEKVASLIALSQQTLDRVDEIQNLVNLDFNRVIYLGAGPFFGLAHEAQLKILELTAGQVATMYESPVGFRHGPKSLVNEQTIVLIFGSTDPYTKQYDLDLVREVAGDEIARKVILLTDKAEGLAKVEEVEMASELLDDIYRTFPYIIYGQLFALLTSLKVKNRPDTPSPTGTVNRVVQGVVIHPFAK